MCNTSHTPSYVSNKCIDTCSRRPAPPAWGFLPLPTVVSRVAPGLDAADLLVAYDWDIALVSFAASLLGIHESILLHSGTWPARSGLDDLAAAETATLCWHICHVALAG